jgi:hypothetical protein
MIKIDFDNFFVRIVKLRECLNEVPKPLKARISSGGKGIHIVSYAVDDNGYREKYDDPQRFWLDKIRKKSHLTNDVLADVKSNGTERKVAGAWVVIKNEKDIEYFIKAVIKL